MSQPPYQGPGPDQPPDPNQPLPGYQPPPANQPPPGYQPPPNYGQPPNYQPPAGGGYAPAPQPSAGYGYGQSAPGAAPPGMYIDPAHGIALPNGVELASRGRRVGAFFLAFPLAIITLVIGYLIWGLVLWGRGTSPSLKVLGMKVWRPAEQRVATFGTMALRDIAGTIVQGILSIITELVSFILFLTGKERKTLPDHIAGTVIVYDPNNVLG